MLEPKNQNQGSIITFTPDSMANGGKTVGRDSQDRALFVPLTIPGETVTVKVTDSKPRYAHGELIEILDPSPERIEPKCPHFGSCSGCHFQHIDYQAQLRYKELVVGDQLRRIGKFTQARVNAVLENPEPWSYSTEVIFHRTVSGQLGFWSSSANEVIPIDVCHIIKKDLLDTYQQVDLNLPSLRRLMLRVGDNGDLLAALEVEDSEAPSLMADVPISVNMILPDGTTVNMVGDNHTVREVRERSFRVTAGCDIYPSIGATELLIDTVLQYAAPSRLDRIVELYSGVGLLTAFLAQSAQMVEGVESSDDAVADLAANLEDMDNVTLYQGIVDEIVPSLGRSPQVLVVQPPRSGLKPKTLDEVVLLNPERLVYVSADIATLARDGRRFAQKDFQLVEVQPIDMWPQTYHTLTVSLWKRGSSD
jgi:23S rRNA (uracil1939-C5)-methyltransferase